MTQTPTEYLANLYKRRYTPFIIKGNGEGFYICKGELIPSNEFCQQFPLSETIRPYHEGKSKGENPDKTRII